MSDAPEAPPAEVPAGDAPPPAEGAENAEGAPPVEGAEGAEGEA